MLGFLKEKSSHYTENTWDRKRGEKWMKTSYSYLIKFKAEYRFRLEDRTSNQYVLAMKQLLAYCDKPFSDIQSKDVRNWMSYMQGQGYKASSLKSKLAGIKLFYKYCME